MKRLPKYFPCQSMSCEICAFSRILIRIVIIYYILHSLDVCTMWPCCNINVCKRTICHRWQTHRNHQPPEVLQGLLSQSRWGGLRRNPRRRCRGTSWDIGGFLKQKLCVRSPAKIGNLTSKDVTVVFYPAWNWGYCGVFRNLQPEEFFTLFNSTVTSG